MIEDAAQPSSAVGGRGVMCYACGVKNERGLHMEFRREGEFVRPPRVVQRVLFALLSPLARARGYRAINPEYLGPDGKIPLWYLLKSYRDGYVYTGQYSRRLHRRHGRQSRDLPPHRFVVGLRLAPRV